MSKELKKKKKEALELENIFSSEFEEGPHLQKKVSLIEV